MENYIEVRRTDNSYLFNFLKPDGTILSKEWFRRRWVPGEGFTIIQREDYVYNYLKPDGTFLSEEWFEDAWDFNDGLAVVRRKDGDLYYLRTDGTLTKRD